LSPSFLPRIRAKFKCKNRRRTDFNRRTRPE
jgi:hypothetical protein